MENGFLLADISVLFFSPSTKVLTQRLFPTESFPSHYSQILRGHTVVAIENVAKYIINKTA
jgi:hypothetical protein